MNGPEYEKQDGTIRLSKGEDTHLYVAGGDEAPMFETTLKWGILKRLATQCETCSEFAYLAKGKMRYDPRHENSEA